MDFMICRDQRTGGEYKLEDDPPVNGNTYPNQAADIEVEIKAGPFHKGSGEADDPDSADVSGGAEVLKDVPKVNPATGEILPGEFVFRAGQIIELTSEELAEAEEQALDEAREAAIPEYSPC
jgi:hypothetical protein